MKKEMIIIIAFISFAAFALWYKLTPTYNTKSFVQDSTIPVSTKAYLKAKEICGQRGIFDLSWKNFDNGEIESVYCKRY